MDFDWEVVEKKKKKDVKFGMFFFYFCFDNILMRIIDIDIVIVEVMMFVY